MRTAALLLSTLAVAFSAAGQGVFQDIMAGTLINPEKGVYSWYELKDAEDGRTLFVRQAIVDEKKVQGKKGYYLETEIIPEVGFPVIYKMLLTGPATQKENVHEIIVREGFNEPEKIALDSLESPDDDQAEAVRTSLGTETVVTPAGEIQAERFSIEQAGETTEVWISDSVRPMGIVKMISQDGELLLSRSGQGGEDGESALNRLAPEEMSPDVKVRVETGPSRNFSGRNQ
ncbi:MAG: DUF3108 domain-containing protein [Candidatus Hydrogenedens sp.]|jgi:hypothetical protein|nr:DUF3108 domain-containing protein [Candidatus Hydrogenedens sp.]